MIIKDISSGTEYEAVIEPLLLTDFKVIKNEKTRFKQFNWEKYKGREVYKLRLIDNPQIFGIMCITDHTDVQTNAIEIDLLEVSDENVGSKKQLDGIGGCLIAYACREAFKRNHDGFVFLIPKTDLIKHYKNYYGFDHIPLRTADRPEGIMVLYGENSLDMIRKYLG